jgi:hypothetical protein
VTKAILSVSRMCLSSLLILQSIVAYPRPTRLTRKTIEGIFGMPGT